MKQISLIIISTMLIIFSAQATNEKESRKIFEYIQNDNFPMMTSLIESGIDVNIRDHNSFNNTPLMEIAFKLEKYDDNYLGIAKLLLEEGANPNLRNVFNSTALLHAVKLHSNEYFLELLYNFDGDLDSRYFNNGGTLLHAVMENPKYGSINILRFLLDKTTLVNAATNAGITPLMLAASRNCRPNEGCGFKRNEIRELAERGALVNLKDKYYDFTALEFLIDSVNETYTEDLGDVEYLIKKGTIVTKRMIKFAGTPSLKKLLTKYYIE